MKSQIAYMEISLFITSKIPKMQDTLLFRDFFGFFGLMQNHFHTLKMRKKNKKLSAFYIACFQN